MSSSIIGLRQRIRNDTQSRKERVLDKVISLIVTDSPIPYYQRLSIIKKCIKIYKEVKSGLHKLQNTAYRPPSFIGSKLRKVIRNINKYDAVEFQANQLGNYGLIEEVQHWREKSLLLVLSSSDIIKEFQFSGEVEFLKNAFSRSRRIPNSKYSSDDQPTWLGDPGNNHYDLLYLLAAGDDLRSRVDSYTHEHKLPYDGLWGED